LFLTGRIPFSQAKKIHPVLNDGTGWKGLSELSEKRQFGGICYGLFVIGIEWQLLLAPVFLLLRRFLDTVLAGYLEFGSTVVTGENFPFFRIGSQGKLSSTNRTFSHDTPP
jgi:hypothetical protein